MEILVVMAFLTLLGLALALLILIIVANWKIYVKIGEAGWKCLIPFYGTYVRFKRIWNTKAAVITLSANLVVILTYLASGISMAVGMARGNYEPNPLLFSIPGMLIMAAFGISLSLSLIVANKQAESFGRNVGTTLGLILLPFIFVPVLGFGSAQYHKKAPNTEPEALPAPEEDASESPV